MQLNLFEFFYKRDLIFFLFGLLVSNVFLLFIRPKSMKKSDLSENESSSSETCNESDSSESSSISVEESVQLEENDINEDETEIIIEE